jgi:dihydrofolate synthase/folylpolyglutamate synthase
MDYCEALEFLYSHVDFEKDGFIGEKWRDLSSLKTLLQYLGDPQDYLLRINIVGTNGKGSTGAILSSILRSAGYKVGFFSSPHLRFIRERIQINGRPISKEDFTDCIMNIKKFAEIINEKYGNRNEKHGFRTVFEILTALALHHFRRENVDIAIMEAGLGGRLDATNVGRPQFLCITPISYDHCYILGESIEDISREKASTIKENQPVAVAPQHRKALKVIEDIAKKRHAILKTVEKDLSLKITSISLNGTEFKIDGEQYRTPLIGYHQGINSALAFLVIRLLSLVDINISKDAIRDGIKNAKWPGRMMLVSQNPPIILDGAHNPDGAEKLVQTMKDVYDGREPIAVIGINENKDIHAILHNISKITKRVIFTSSSHPHAKAPEHLSEIFKNYGDNGNIRIARDARRALDIALNLSKGEPILITGSLYLVGNILDILDIEIYA